MEQWYSTNPCKAISNTPKKSKFDSKTEMNYVKIKLHRNLMSEKSDMYEFKMAFFEKWMSRIAPFVCVKLQYGA